MTKKSLDDVLDAAFENQRLEMWAKKRGLGVLKVDENGKVVGDDDIVYPSILNDDGFGLIDKILLRMDRTKSEKAIEILGDRLDLELSKL